MTKQPKPHTQDLPETSGVFTELVTQTVAAPADAPKPFWHPVIAIVIAGVIFVGTQIAASLPFILYPSFRGWTADQANTWVNGTYAQFAFVAIAEVLTFLALRWFTHRGGLRLRDLGWRRFNGWAIIYALCGFAVYFVAYIILLAVAGALLPGLNQSQGQDIGFNDVSGGLQLFVTFISLVVLPPIVEETFFRGFLFTSFRRRMGFVMSALLTSALFAVPHLLESKQPGSLLWVGGIDTFTLSLVLCYLREKTNSLWPGVLLHGIKNGIAFVALYIFVGR